MRFGSCSKPEGEWGERGGRLGEVGEDGRRLLFWEDWDVCEGEAERVRRWDLEPRATKPVPVS